MEYNLYPSSVAVQHAIHLLIANYYKVCEGVDAEENEYFLNLGRMGLQYIEKENLLNKPVFNWIKEDNWYLRSELGEESEYSKVREDIIHLGLFDFIEEQIKEYYRLYNRKDNKIGETMIIRIMINFILMIYIIKDMIGYILQ